MALGGLARKSPGQKVINSKVAKHTGLECLGASFRLFLAMQGDDTLRGYYNLQRGPWSSTACSKPLASGLWGHGGGREYSAAARVARRMTAGPGVYRDISHKRLGAKDRLHSSRSPRAGGSPGYPLLSMGRGSTRSRLSAVRAAVG